MDQQVRDEFAETRAIAREIFVRAMGRRQARVDGANVIAEQACKAAHAFVVAADQAFSDFAFAKARAASRARPKIRNELARR